MLYGRAILLLTTLLMLACPAAAQKRVALVVGNSNYVALSKLKNPTNDAQLMARTLSGLGFTLVDGGPLLNLSKQSLEGAVQRFREAAEDAEIPFSSFAGHGLVERNPTNLPREKRR